MWYYKKDRDEIGPLPDQLMHELVREGKITGYTAVRRETGEWTSLALTPLSESVRSYAARPVAEPGQARPNRFGFGLTLLCALLVLAGPAAAVKTGYDMADFLDKGLNGFPGALVMTIINGLITLGITAFGVYAGLLLWTLAPNALRMARVFLLANLVAAALALLIYFLVRLGLRMDEQFSEVLVWAMIFAVFNFLVWAPYLSFSSRVKQTYGMD